MTEENIFPKIKITFMMELSLHQILFIIKKSPQLLESRKKQRKELLPLNLKF